MREIYKAGVTPQQKIVGINQKFGNTGIKSQQGTSRILYDTIENTGQTTIKFFEDSASRTFPLTNTGSEGNKLGVGDSMVISQILFSVPQKRIAAPFEWLSALNLLALYPEAALGYVNVVIANNQVIKKLTLTEANVSFNKDTNTVNNVIDLETAIVIPPLLPFTVELVLPQSFTGGSPNFTRFFQCQIIGVGGIIAPRTTF